MATTNSKGVAAATDSQQTADTIIWWHKMPLVLYKGSSSGHCDDGDDDLESNSVRIESLENNGQEKCPVQRYKGQIYTRKRRRAAGSMSSKTKIEQKHVLFDGNGNISSHSKADNDYYFEPPMPMRNRRRRKTEKKPLFIDISSSSCSEGMIDSDDNYEPKIKKKKVPMKKLGLRKKVPMKKPLEAAWSNRDDDYEQTIQREPSRKNKKKVPMKKPGIRRRSKPSSEDIDNEEAACGGVKSPSPDTDDYLGINFEIVLGNGSVIGSSILPAHVRMAYYRLCQDRNALLHRNLLKTISPKFAAEMIREMVTIVKAIRASSLASLEDLVSWKKTLDSFELLGMDIAFLCKRIEVLLGVLSAPSSTKGEQELKLERARAANTVRDLESRLLVYKNNLHKMGEMVEMLELRAKKNKDQAVRTLATAPW